MALEQRTKHVSWSVVSSSNPSQHKEVNLHVLSTFSLCRTNFEALTYNIIMPLFETLYIDFLRPLGYIKFEVQR